MNEYVNFFPGNYLEPRGLFASEIAAYYVGDVGELLNGMGEGFAVSCTICSAQRYLVTFTDVEVENAGGDLQELIDLVTSQI